MPSSGSAQARNHTVFIELEVNTVFLSDTFPQKGICCGKHHARTWILIKQRCGFNVPLVKNWPPTHLTPSLDSLVGKTHEISGPPADRKFQSYDCLGFQSTNCQITRVLIGDLWWFANFLKKTHCSSTNLKNIEPNLLDFHPKVVFKQPNIGFNILQPDAPWHCKCHRKK